MQSFNIVRFICFTHCHYKHDIEVAMLQGFNQRIKLGMQNSSQQALTTM